MSVALVMLCEMETLVLLHGFAGTGRAWDPVRDALSPGTYRPLAPDLPGHGAAAADDASFAACVAAVLAAAPPRFALAGYSMGGRVALRVALAAPERVTRLGLVATTAGLEAAEERAARRAADAELAGWIERHDTGAFADRWLAQPLFAGDDAAADARARADIARNAPAGLAASLRGAGTGSMPSLWDDLGALAMPAAVVVGERDAKFRALGDRLAAALPDATVTVVAGAGHALPRSHPAAVAAALDALAARPSSV
jgi:2-succinyl-6-hydroxy-2,4-cyclohexadiene-1-carboxylate synthase